jgi:hypothetical protein
MKFDRLRRSVVRLFRRAATQGRGGIARTPSSGVAVETFRPMSISLTFDPMPGVGEQPIAELDAPSTTHIMEPTPIDWATWRGYADENHRHGWSFCCFGIRSAEGGVNFVRGIVRGPFGVHGEAMMLGNPVCQEKPVWGITHLRGGFGCGLFLSMEAATSAAEIAARLALDWDAIDVNSDDRAPLTATLGRTHLAWVNANLMPAPFLAHHKNPSVPPMNVWYRDYTPETRPEKPS